MDQQNYGKIKEDRQSGRSFRADNAGQAQPRFCGSQLDRGLTEQRIWQTKETASQPLWKSTLVA